MSSAVVSHEHPLDEPSAAHTMAGGSGASSTSP